MRNIVILLFLILSWQSISAQEFKTESGQVEFISKAPLSEFSGTSKNLNGLIDLEKNLLDFFIDLNTLKTGIGLRDRHMRENYLETKKFPFAEFTGKMEKISAMEPGKTHPVKALGTFKIHGVEKEMEIEGTLKLVDNNNLELEASFKVLLGDHDIGIPKVMFYELAEEQLVNIKAVLKK